MLPICGLWRSTTHERKNNHAKYWFSKASVLMGSSRRLHSLGSLRINKCYQSSCHKDLASHDCKWQKSRKIQSQPSHLCHPQVLVIRTFNILRWSGQPDALDIHSSISSKNAWCQAEWGSWGCRYREAISLPTLNCVFMQCKQILNSWFDPLPRKLMEEDSYFQGMVTESKDVTQS